MKIVWQTRSQLLFESIEKGKINPKANGGNAYDFEAAMALRSVSELKADADSVYRSTDNFLSYWSRMRRHLPAAHYRVMEPYPIVFGGRFSESFNVAMMHHVDAKAETGGLKHWWFYHRLFDRMRSFDKVVTVSKYWEQYLHDKGCQNVEVIYNSFDIRAYEFSAEELNEFRLRLGFGLEKPLIYLGNASAGKGVHEAYEALKHCGHQLVMTGGSNKASDLPVKFLSLPSEDYRKLIASCDVVLTMSNMMEGWNRVAHEAMLCKVPVIGTGSGGMLELLEGGKQQVTTDFSELPERIELAISQRGRFTHDGFGYVSRFDTAYFKNKWRAIIQ